MLFSMLTALRVLRAPFSFFLFLVALRLSTQTQVRAQCQPSSTPFRFPPTTAPGLSAHLVFSNLSTPRGLAFSASGALVIVERGVGVSAFVQGSDSGACSGGFERTVVIPNTELTHGIVVQGREVYVSTQEEVLLYLLEVGVGEQGMGVVQRDPKVIVRGLPSDGDLTTRTLLLVPAKAGREISIVVSDGPLANVDFTAQVPENGRSQVRMYALGPEGEGAPRVPVGGWVWPGGANSTTTSSSGSSDTTKGKDLEGTLLAFGIRNAAGLSLAPDPLARPDELWVVENGASLDDVVGEAGSVDNPADELELVDLGAGSGGSSRFYGFPFCHTGFAPLPEPFDVIAPGDQFSINATTGVTNAVCRNASFNVPPRLIFQPHSVPLDIKFYRQAESARATRSGPGLPTEWFGDAFSSFHGSFDRTPPTGYGVVRIPWQADGSGPIASGREKMGYEFIVHVPDLNVCPDGCVRPVGLAFDDEGRLFVSSDSTGEVFFISRD